MVKIRHCFVLVPDVHQGEAAVCRPRQHQLRQGPPPAHLHHQKGLQTRLEPPFRLQDQVLSAVHHGFIYKHCLNHGEHNGNS